MRPTFSVGLPLPQDTAIENIRARLAARDPAARWRGKGRWVEIYVPESERRVWSPYLSVRVDEADSGSRLFGRFSPHPEVWTFFMFVYATVAFLVVFGATLGYVQWSSGEPAWGLWAVWAGVPSLALIHGASRLGQHLGQQQMAQLRSDLNHVIADLGEAADRQSPST